MSDIISSLVNYFKSSPFNVVWMLLVLWLIWPGTMFIVGMVGESRLVPIVKRQSRAFLPGDLSLAVMFLALLSLHDRTCSNPLYWGYNPEWWICVMVVMLFVAMKLRAGDVVNYPPRSGNSPTKLAHDAIGYWFIPSCLIALGVPQLADIFMGESEILISWLVFSGAIIFYGICVAVDAVKGWTPEDVAARHPENWTPIWAQKK